MCTSCRSRTSSMITQRIAQTTWIILLPPDHDIYYRETPSQTGTRVPSAMSVWRLVAAPCPAVGTDGGEGSGGDGGDVRSHGAQHSVRWRSAGPVRLDHRRRRAGQSSCRTAAVAPGVPLPRPRPAESEERRLSAGWFVVRLETSCDYRLQIA